ncbi:hypothetical protein B0J14DRAFT_607383 [Halenospora varia]|nr:hypothetical protein B0J14DRAFT_607383 [Halenospora varia]
MSGQLLRQFAFPSGKKMSLFLAQSVNDQGFHRVVDAIDPKVKEAMKLEEFFSTTLLSGILARSVGLSSDLFPGIFDAEQVARPGLGPLCRRCNSLAPNLPTYADHWLPPGPERSSLGAIRTEAGCGAVLLSLRQPEAAANRQLTRNYVLGLRVANLARQRKHHSCRHVDDRIGRPLYAPQRLCNGTGEDDTYIVLIAEELLFYLVNECVYKVGGSP